MLDAYSRALRLGDLMWQHHFEFLLLGYGAYATFAEFCKTHLPDIPDQHIAQMVAGIDVLLFKPDGELRRLARLALDMGVDAAFASGRTPAEIDAELEQSDAGREWLAELEKVKDPWFNMATGDGLYHYYRSWLDDPRIPYASLTGHIEALRAGASAGAADGARSSASASGSAQEYSGAARRGRAPAVRGAARALAHRVPVRRGAQVLLRLLVPDAAGGTRSGSSARCWRSDDFLEDARGRLPADPP